MRPTKLDDELIAAAKSYIDQYEKAEQSIPSIAGLATYLKVARSTLYKWAEETDVFSDILSELMDVQENVLLTKGLNSSFNSTITKLILTKHGYSDKQEIQQETRVSFDQLSDEELEEIVQRHED